MSTQKEPPLLHITIKFINPNHGRLQTQVNQNCTKCCTYRFLAFTPSYSLPKLQFAFNFETSQSPYAGDCDVCIQIPSTHHIIPLLRSKGAIIFPPSSILRELPAEFAQDRLSSQVTGLVSRISCLYTVGFNITTKIDNHSVNRGETKTHNLQY